MAGTYAALKSEKLLEGQMEHRGFNCASLAEAVSYELIRARTGRGVSRQMISYLRSGRVKTCTPALAVAIERVLDVPAQTLFDVVSKSHDKRHDVKGSAA